MGSDAAPSDEGLARKVAKGAGWILAARFAMRVLGFVNTIVLARLLAPHDFGVIAVGTTAFQLLQGLTDIGVSQAVVRFQDTTRDEVDTLFTLSAARGVLVAAVMIAVAPFAGAFYGDPRMAAVFLGLAALPLLSGLINPRFYEFERNIDFSKEFIWEVAAKTLGVAATLAAALVWRSYWAIVLGAVAGAAAQVALSYAMRPHAPRLTLRAAKRVLSFSGWLTGVSFVIALSNKLDSFVLARTAGAADTGKYWMGFQLAELPTSELAWPIARAVYPGLSALQGDPGRMRAAFLRGIEVLAATALPAALGVAFVARDLVYVVLGPKWQESAFIVSVLAPSIGFQIVLLATQYYALALDLPRLVFMRGLIMLAFKAPVFIWAAATSGVKGAVFAASATTAIGALLNLGIYGRASGRSPIEPILHARRSYLAAAAMAAYFLLARPVVAAFEPAWPALRLGVEVASGVLVYLGAHLAAWFAEGRPHGVERSLLEALRKINAK